MTSIVVIPTLNAKNILDQALASLHGQTTPTRVMVVDNASTDGTAEMVATKYPNVQIVRNEENLGFGRAINAGLRAAGDADVLVLVNNDVICCPDFIRHITDPFSDPSIGMVAGVLTQMRAPDRVDSAGIVLDGTLGSADFLSDRPVRTAEAPSGDDRLPMGPCGGAAAYRMSAFRAVGGFDEAFFAYWEDVDLAMRLRLAGWSCALAGNAQAEHRHGATLGAASPRQRALEAFGRGYVLGRYRVTRGRPGKALAVAIRDWPGLLSHLLFRRELTPIRERRRGYRTGIARAALRPPFELAGMSTWHSVLSQWAFLARRLTGRLPAHYSDRSGAAS